MKTTNMGADDGMDNETARRVLASSAMWGGWSVAGVVFAWATFVFNPNQGHFAPQWVGFTFIGALCVAIAGTLVRSRMRLQDTITKAFEIGLMSARVRSEIQHKELMDRTKDFGED